MKQIKITLIGIISAFMVVCAASSASAATEAFSNAIIDYSSFNVSYSGTGSYSINSFTAWAETSSSNVEDSADARIQLTDTGGNETLDSWGSIDFDEFNELYSHAYVTNIVDYALSGAEASGTYTAESAGTLTLSASYYIEAQAWAAMGGSASVETLAYLFIGDEDSVVSYNFSAYGELTTDYDLGWLTIEFDVDLEEGDVVAFGVGTETLAKVCSVPVPGAGFLLGAGLMALAGFRRK